ncbi:MAG: bifunctional 4-hydroxy-3-methylbut-2-enyl diphosphate reductase/30S ribosomal protein S1 [Clostridiales bacterium]|jgi:4-hydroxy-3-methylbut-2-enyl diphosphate reductase|nr:bifunctional 4-hydroxy-3-methylbut-2-enyl diphosphate reductase/30S ribosomal protein S1 [Clostridiales bacterium]
MKVVVAKQTGFCPGVADALEKVEKQAEKGRVCTLGPLINNKYVTEQLEKKGVRVINDVSEAEDDETIVIRTHGAPPEVYQGIRGRDFIDCTCAFVKKIHNIAALNVLGGKRTIIAGDRDHPEIIGIKGRAGADYIIVENADDAEALELDSSVKYAVVAQTTFSSDVFDEIVERLKRKNEDIVVFNTICSSMLERQREAAELSSRATAMVVIGDKLSSNSTKLHEICAKICPKTIFVERLEDLRLNIFNVNDIIGIVTGASAPPDLIEEALLAMSGLENTVSAPNGSQSFEEMLDESFVTLHNGDVVNGTVIRVSNGEVSVNLGYKSDGVIPRIEYSDDPDADPERELNPGDVIEVYVSRINDGEGSVLLSKKKLDYKRSFDAIEQAFNEKTPVNGKIVEVVKGGVVAIAKGVRMFVPSSQMSNRYVADLSQFKGKELNFDILELDRAKRRVVGGRKALAEKEQNEAREKVFDSITVGQDVTGVVNRIVDFGAFVDLGGVDGLIHISQLSWSRVNKVTDVLTEGQRVTARVLDIDKSKGRISLSIKNTSPDPWLTIAQKYKIGDIVNGKVVRMAAFGAFIELEEGVDGLVHVSQISFNHVVKPEDVLEIGQIIQVKIMDVNTDNNRISLSKKEADGARAADYGDLDSDTEQVYSSEDPVSDASYATANASETYAEPTVEEPVITESPVDETLNEEPLDAETPSSDVEPPPVDVETSSVDEGASFGDEPDKRPPLDSNVDWDASEDDVNPNF